MSPSDTTNVSCPMAGTKIFARTAGHVDVPTHYCPGCTHGVAHRMVGEVLEELGVLGRAAGVAPVGCSVLAYDYFQCDMYEASHGRAPAVATGCKRCRPDMVVFTYQGDGDLASIGMAEIIHAANRGEKFTVVFINNAIYGMTGGQMAPTTMPGQVTSTSPYGRNVEEVGWPIRMCELLSALKTPAYITRGSLHDPKHIIQSKAYLKKAFEHQIENRCFTFVELLSTCPTNWGLTTKQSARWLVENMLPYYPLGEKKTPEEV